MGDKKRKRRYSSFLIVIPVNTKVLFPFLSLLLSRGGDYKRGSPGVPRCHIDPDCCRSICEQLSDAY